MSESSISVSARPRRQGRLWAAVIAMPVILLVLVYLGGYFILPNTIRSAFQENNCAAVLSRSDVYARVYPAADQELSAQIGECAVYTLALTYQQESAWQDAYNALTVYSEAYPQGRFADDVHKRLSLVLIGLARDEIERKNHVRGMTLIGRVLREYDDPAIVQEAQSLQLELLVDWGTSLRDAGHFADAEHIFMEVQKSTAPDYVETAELALAQTYLAWGHELQSQHQFDAARLKIDAAMSMDPHAQSKAEQAEFYKQWGDYLLEQGDHANAMGRYAIAAALVQEADPAAAKEIVANGYIRWAETLGDKDDFLGALVLLDFAQENSSTDSIKVLINTTKADTYLAFSKSDGEQARKAMQDAARMVCNHHTSLKLPIFGLDGTTALFGIFGVDVDLPEGVAAKSPGEMRRVVCVEESSRVIQRAVPYPNYLLIREKYSWDVVLRDAETGQKIDSTIIEGSEPRPLPTTPYEIAQGGHFHRYFGDKPDIAELVKWIQSVQ